MIYKGIVLKTELFMDNIFYFPFTFVDLNCLNLF